MYPCAQLMCSVLYSAQIHFQWTSPYRYECWTRCKLRERRLQRRDEWLTRLRIRDSAKRASQTARGKSARKCHRMSRQKRQRPGNNKCADCWRERGYSSSTTSRQSQLVESSKQKSIETEEHRQMRLYKYLSMPNSPVILSSCTICTHYMSSRVSSMC